MRESETRGERQNAKCVMRFNMPMIIPCSVLAPTFQTTNSDVMCTTNTPQRLDWNKRTSASSAKAACTCRLPYEELLYAGTAARCDDGTMTAMEKRQSEAARLRRNKELHAEHREFMEQLKRERDDRTRIESESALVIQRAMRGYAVRQRMNPEKFNSMRKPFRYTDKEIRHYLIDATQRLGMPPMPGYTLDISEEI